MLDSQRLHGGEGDQPVNLNFREIYRNQKHLSQVYDSALINAFNERGYDIREKGKSFELADVTDEQIAAFSTRREDIEKALKAKGLSYELASDEERQYACFATRRKKVLANKTEMAREWRERADKVNLSFESTRSLNDSSINKKLEYVGEAFKEAAELDGIFTAKSVYAKAIKKAREDGYGISPREVEELFNAESMRGLSRFPIKNPIHGFIIGSQPQTLFKLKGICARGSEGKEDNLNL